MGAAPTLLNLKIAFGVVTVVVSATTWDGAAATALPAAVRCPLVVRAGAGDACVALGWVDEAALVWFEAESFPSAVWPEPAGLTGGNSS